MESTVTKLPKSTVKLAITLTPQDMQRYFVEATKRAAQQVNVEGFRKGKAPRSILEARLGQDYLAHQALELAVADSYYQAIQKHNLRPVSRPTTDLKDQHKNLEEKGLSFSATVAVSPELTLGSYRAVRVKPVETTYSDKLVDQTLEQLRRSRASTAQVTRAAKTGDKVEIDFVGTIGGKQFPGGKSENHPLTIGEGSFIPGFEDELVGLQAGQVKKFKLKFPKDYREASLAGKSAEFTVTLKQVQAETLPKADDDFAKNFGAASLTDLRQRLAENLKQEKALEARRQTEMAVIEKVVKAAKVEIPDPMIDDELTTMLAELRQQIERQGLPYEKYLEHLKKTEDDIKREQRGQAEHRVKMSLVLNAIQAAEKIKPSESEVQAEIKRQLQATDDVDAKERIKGEEFKAYVRRVLGNRLAVERLVEQSTKS